MPESQEGEVEFSDNREVPGQSDSDRLSAVWDTLRTPILRVLDRDGVNKDGQVIRYLADDTWIIVNDVDGYDLIREEDLDLWSVHNLEYSLEVVD